MYLVNTRRRARRRLARPSLPPQRWTQAARTAATRRKLIASAARLFARDGFEAARLEDIAAAAGYTRGALYANFRDKEDLFFALLEDWIGERIAELDELLRKQAPNPAAKLRTLRSYYAQCAKDRRLVLLSLEFTLYAMRHPAAHARLRIRKRRLRAHSAVLIRDILQSSKRRHAAASARSTAVSVRATMAALAALSNGLLLEHVVDPKTMTDTNVRYLLGVFFDALLPPPPVR